LAPFETDETRISVSLFHLRKKLPLNNDSVGGVPTKARSKRVDLGNAFRHSTKRKASHVGNSRTNSRSMNMLALSDLREITKIILMGVFMQRHVAEDEGENGEMA
jgi:hypothetical protein